MYDIPIKSHYVPIKWATKPQFLLLNISPKGHQFSPAGFAAASAAAARRKEELSLHIC